MKQSYVYFIQRGSSGPIKIGKSTGNPKERLRELQISSPERLYLIGFIHGVERDVHERFATLRISGEWFSPNEDLIRFVRLNQASLGKYTNNDLPYSTAPSDLLVEIENYRVELSKRVGLELPVSAAIRSILREYFAGKKKRKRAA